MINQKNMTLKEMLHDDSVSYRDFYHALQDLQEKGIGYWDEVNSTDILHDYINEMMRNGIVVSHMLKAIEENSCDTDDWKIWLGNSMNTPVPIRSKEELLEALDLTEEDL